MDLTTGQEFQEALDHALAKASQDGHGYAVLAVMPQQLPGEGTAKVMRAVSPRLRELVRADDLAGRMDDEALVVGFLTPDRDRAEALASRLQSDLRLRSHHVQNTVWESGVACLPEDGATAEKLLEMAVDAARTRRRRLAAQ